MESQITSQPAEELRALLESIAAGAWTVSPNVAGESIVYTGDGEHLACLPDAEARLIVALVNSARDSVPTSG